MLFALLAAALAALAQREPQPPSSGSSVSDEEKQALGDALSDAGNSPVDFIRALENHLVKFPASSQRSEIEAAILKASIEAKDDKRIIQYGSRVLERRPGDPLTLERVSRALLDAPGKANSERGLGYARRLEAMVRELAARPPSPQASVHDQARMQDEVERLLARSLAYQARALGNLGQYAEAIALARKSYQTAPSAEAARETGKWLSRAGQDWEAIPYLADAFTIPDPKVTEAARQYDRQRLGELYQKVKNTQAGLGDLVLEAYDRTSAQVADRRARLKLLDPNAQTTEPLDFTITSVKGERLDLKTLKGKVVVMDFWATWCGPCRVQHPLYEDVKKSFADNRDVVFLSINTDDERSPVPLFVQDQKWDPAMVYYDDGLQVVLRVSSIPTTVIFNRSGQVASRMNGFLPDRFVEVLTGRIRQSLAE